MNACLEKEFLKDKRLLSTEHTQWVQIISERAFEHALAFSHIFSICLKFRFIDLDVNLLSQKWFIPIVDR